MKICNTPECRRMRELISEFIDHTLHWRTARSLEVHLGACTPCRCYVATIERTIVLYRERPVVDVPVAVRGHLREVLRERHEGAPRKRAARCHVAKETVNRAGGTAPAKTAKRTAKQS